MSTLQNTLSHIKSHAEYPATSHDLITTCNNFSDVPSEDKTWFESALPEGTYNSADDVVKAVMAKA